MEPLSSCFHNFDTEPSPELKAPSNAPPPSSITAGSKPCFDCNICLDFACDPVVTLCGHLYCSPCIHRWINLGASPRCCPVCKSQLTRSSLVPLYGCGLSSKPRNTNPNSSRPARPQDRRNCASPAPVMHPNDRLHGIAFAVLLPAFAVLLPAFAGRQDRRRSRKPRAESWLHQIWLFLFYCAVMCLLFF